MTIIKALNYKHCPSLGNVKNILRDLQTQLLQFICMPKELN